MSNVEHGSAGGKPRRRPDGAIVVRRSVSSARAHLPPGRSTGTPRLPAPSCWGPRELPHQYRIDSPTARLLTLFVPGGGDELFPPGRGLDVAATLRPAGDATSRTDRDARTALRRKGARASDGPSRIGLRVHTFHVAPPLIVGGRGRPDMRLGRQPVRRPRKSTRKS
jgi:hypothetical protein